jgi:predicted GNAT superfamily acetyltransferase
MTSVAELQVRACESHAELDACVQLQIRTWGYTADEAAPRKIFILAQELGGQVIGAFAAGGELVGFAMSMAAVDKDGAPYLHSHMLAVRPEYRDQGLGVRLKLAQRADALRRGLRRMTWTFDPLAAKNAHFNLHRLGVTACRYSENFYGVSSSRLQGGLPTDRLHAEWRLESARVERSSVGAAHAPLPAGRTIELPSEVQTWKSSATREDAERLVAAQSRLRGQFQQAFEQGWVVADFINGAYALLRREQIQDLLYRKTSGDR